MRTILILTLALAGCADTADTFPTNEAAHRIGRPRVEFMRTGVGRGPVTITMPDGELLKGEYRVAHSAAVGFATVGRFSGSSVVVGDGPVQFVATGPKTEMLCRGTSSALGHGNGECQTYEGAVWTLSW